MPSLILGWLTTYIALFFMAFCYFSFILYFYGFLFLIWRQFILWWFCFGFYWIILWTPGMMVSFLFLVFMFIFVFSGHLKWWCHYFVYLRILFSFVDTWNVGFVVLSIFEFYFNLFFFHFKDLCEFMSNKFKSKSRLRTRNDKNYVESLDNALIITLFMCLA